ncbi:MAG TPA: hypothetical protein VHV81_13455 [Steroidobacteraceae bacterium]|nr:hypothetical protein [Steroidobacteraceae bacterium]
MKYSDETLMAFADGELDAALRAEIESALEGDAELERRVAAHRALRARVHEAYAGELDEMPPQRLLDVLGAGAVSKVAALDDLRARRRERAAAPRWLALAASVAIGATAGYLAFDLGPRAQVTSKGGVLVADASLEKSLSSAASGEGVGSTPRIGMTYRSKSGALCRSFTASALAGVACRDGGEWRIRVLAQIADAGAGAGGYRTAGSELPPAVRGAIEADIDGEPLDAAAERDALSRVK